MLLLFFGQDTYRLHKRLEKALENFKKSSGNGLSLKLIDKEKESNFSFENFLDEFQQRSIFEKEKLFVLKNFFSDQQFCEKFLKNYKKFLKNGNIIFYEERKLLKGESFFKFFKREGKIEEYDFLKEKELGEWVRTNFNNLKITDEALNEIIGSVGSDLWRMSNEIEKLVSFKKGTIEIDDVKNMVESKTEAFIFKTIDAIALSDKKLALNLIHKHLKKGDSPYYLLSMINYQFRNIISVKDMVERNNNYTQSVKESGLHPFVFKKSLDLSKKFTKEDLKKIYRKIFQTDLNIKTGKIESEASLDFLISSI
jgi:DNA polymerase III subunit delta